MSKKIFFIVLICCLLVATFCVSFAGAPLVQHAPANVRAVLDRSDCASAPLIVPPVVEPLDDVVSSDPFDIDFPFVMTSLTGTSFSEPGIYSVALKNYMGDQLDTTYTIYNESDTPFATIVGFRNFPSEFDFVSEYTPFQFLYQDVLIVLMQFTYSPVDDIVVFTFFDANDVETVISFEYDPVAQPSVFFRSVAPFETDSVSTSLFAYYTVDSVPIISDLSRILVSGLRALGTNVGRAFSTMANAIFINTDGTGLSTFGILVVVFAAVSLGLSLTRWVLNFCSSWGKRNR